MLDYLISAFTGQHQNQSAQSMSAAVARDLGLMNQYFTYENMTYSQLLNSLMLSQEYQYNKALQNDQLRNQVAMQESAYGYDKALALLSHALNTESAQKDYSRSVRYVGDSLAAYKKALIANGYNPLLALGSSAAQYSGHTNPVGNLGAMAPGSAAGSSIGGKSVSGGSPAQGSGIGVPSASVPNRAPIMDTIKSAFELAKTSSEIKSNEASAQRDKASAAESLEKAKTEANQRTDVGHKIQSETASNYGKIASGVVTGIGTAWGASKASRYLKGLSDKVSSAVKSGKAPSLSPSDLTTAQTSAVNEIAGSANSANLGSKMMKTFLLALPLLGGAAAYGTGKQGMKDAIKGAKSGDDNWYDKWRRIYFPMTGGF